MVPEKLNYKQNQEKSKMKSVKPGRNKQVKEDNAPVLIGEIKLDTGKLQIGYDEKHKKIVFSFVQDELASDQREVIENASAEKFAHDRESFRSRDINYYHERAVSGHCDVKKSRFMLERQFDRISEKNNYKTMIDRVIPFHHIKEEKDQLEQLKQMKSNSKTERSDIHTAMSTIHTAETKKEHRKLDFSQKFIKAMNDAKKASEFKSKDDYFLYLQKKRLVAEALDELEKLLGEEDESEDEENKVGAVEVEAQGGETSQASQEQVESSEAEQDASNSSSDE